MCPFTQVQRFKLLCIVLSETESKNRERGMEGIQREEVCMYCLRTEQVEKKMQGDGWIGR